MQFNKRLATVVLLLLGALAGLSNLLNFGWILTIPFILGLSWLWIESKEFTTKQKILLTWFSGYTFFLILQSWMLSLNVTGVHIFSPAGIASVKILIWVLSCLFWSLGFLILAFIYTLFNKKNYKIHTKYIIFSLAWAASEYIRSILFSILNIGDGSTVGANWNFGSLGLLSIDAPLKYSSRIVGMYGLTFLTLIFVYAVYIIVSKKLLNRYVIIMLLVPVMTSTFGRFNFSESRLFEHEVTIVHAPFVEDFRSLADMEYKFYPSDTSGSRLIVLPEYSAIFSSETDSQKRQEILSSFSTPNGENYFIDANEIFVDEGSKIQLGLFDSNSTMLQEKTKSLLIPGGEYLPYYLEGAFNLLKLEKAMSTYKDSWKIIKGSGGKSFKLGKEKIGAFSCSTILSTEDYRKASGQGATLLTSSADLGFFNMSESYLKNNIKLAKFHATANNRPFVQVARQGVSFIIDRNGNTLDYLIGGDGITVTNYSLITSDHKTIYSKYGDYFLLFSVLILFYLYLTATKLNSSNKSNSNK